MLMRYAIQDPSDVQNVSAIKHLANVGRKLREKPLSVVYPLSGKIHTRHGYLQGPASLQ
jgi:hypothetical protein